VSTVSAMPRIRLARVRRVPPGGVAVAVLILAAIVVMAAVPGLLRPDDPGAQDLLHASLPPGGGHLLGTDALGRDVLSRTITGARPALLGPLAVAVLAWVLGGSAGVVAGYCGGRVDSVIMRVVDGVYALPGLLITIVVSGVLGGGYVLAVVLLGVLAAPNDARVARAAALELRGQPFVEAARMLGTGGPGIVVRHLVPNMLPLQLANATVQFAFAIVALASLSFLGIGADPGSAEWGRMLSDSRTLLYDNPACALAPAVAIAGTAASVSVLGEWLYGRIAARGRAHS
jgi:peptide/nickel transport system permease protein